MGGGGVSRIKTASPLRQRYVSLRHVSLRAVVAVELGHLARRFYRLDRPEQIFSEFYVFNGYIVVWLLRS